MDKFVTNYCFACGKDNDIGLKLEFIDLEGGGSMAYFTPKPEHQGYNDFMHGGLISTLLDELMAREVWVRYAPAVTARLNVEYHHPINIGEEVQIIAHVTNIKRNGKIFEAKAEIISSDKIILARGTSILIKTEK